MYRLWIALGICGLVNAQENQAKARLEPYKQGHSHLGEPFDAGPRQKPWEMQGIGLVHFPITTKSKEAQKWFDQGVTLLHSFWEYEAERSFRWALKLDPENPMIYWGLARSTYGDRGMDFLREALKRKDKATERERLWIEAQAALTSADPLRDRGDGAYNPEREYRKVLETIAVKYPDDLEARAFLALASMGESRYAAEKVIQELLARNPNHPGGHHYRIHNWNYHEPEMALDSCDRYGKIAPGIGHALHMPGHVYATVGMWHEAAISMDAATRAEKRYMLDRLTFPFNNWNYGHNRAYLSYIQEQLGMANAAIFGARQLIDAPLDPDHNSDTGYSSHSQGIFSLLRALVKFERWNELLDNTIPWRDSVFSDKAHKAYARARAHLAMGNLDKADKSLREHAALKKDLDKNKGFEERYNIQALELKARLALAKGETLTGLATLADAAEKHYQMQLRDNDPPFYPESLYVALGRAYLEAKSAPLAVKAFEKALKLTRNDICAFSGLVEAHHAAGNKQEAERYMARLLYTASGADPDIPVLRRARGTGVKAQPKDESPRAQRRYQDQNLDTFGPNTWEPFPAPALEATDSEGKPVTLSEYRGKNVILVFYLGRECLHCMKQLKDINAKKSDWDRLGATVLAISSNKPEDNARYTKELNMPGTRLLSDKNFENARRYRSYDDFEELELHSTILIDKKGRVHWARTGGEPFSKMDFLIKQVERMNKSVETDAEKSTGAAN